MLGAEEPRLDELPEWLATTADEYARAVSSEKIQAHVEALPGPRNRLHAPAAMEEAETYVAGVLRATGWTVERRPYVLHDVRGFRDFDDDADGFMRIYERLEGANLVATRRADDSRRGAIVVGAHLDTVRDSPGADDNGSGVAGVLELARLLEEEPVEREIVLAVFDMEELGFVGSRVLASELNAELEIGGVLVFESIGFSSHDRGSQKLPPGVGTVYRGQVRRIRARDFVGDWTLVIYRDHSRDLARAYGESLAHLAGPDGVVLARDPVDLPGLGTILRRVVPWVQHFSRSDHQPFWELGVPAIQITDTADFRNERYHGADDTPETLDYDLIARVVAATATTVRRLAGDRC